VINAGNRAEGRGAHAFGAYSNQGDFRLRRMIVYRNQPAAWPRQAARLAQHREPDGHARGGLARGLSFEQMVPPLQTTNHAAPGELSEVGGVAYVTLKATNLDGWKSPPRPEPQGRSNRWWQGQGFYLRDAAAARFGEVARRDFDRRNGDTNLPGLEGRRAMRDR
jgi:hypothetical protein